jgi:hypothetical protein
MDTLNSPILAALALAFLFALAHHSQNPCVRYALADACVNGVYTPVTPATPQELAYNYLYSETKEEAARPVIIYKGKR